VPPEELAATAAHLSEQAARLQEIVRYFRIQAAAPAERTLHVARAPVDGHAEARRLASGR